jgi:hypothetical protein
MPLAFSDLSNRGLGTEEQQRRYEQRQFQRARAEC